MSVVLSDWFCVKFIHYLIKMLITHLLTTIVTLHALVYLDGLKHLAISPSKLRTNQFLVEAQTVVNKQSAQLQQTQHSNTSDAPSYIATGKKISKILNDFFDVSIHFS